MKSKKGAKRGLLVRRTVQIIFFIVIASTAIGYSLEEAGITVPVLSSASLHSVCPFGGVVSIYQLAATGTYVKKVHESSLILMFIVFALAFIAGPIFCGWVCPFGSFQEWLGNIGKKLFGKKYNRFIPRKIDRYLRYLRYLVLGWVIYVTAVSGILIFADFDPYFALFNFWTGEVAVTALIILGVVVVLSLFIERPFCKYGCPYGAVLGLFNLFRVFSIRRNETTCINCKKCDVICPMNITVSTGKTVRDHQCISCMQCSSENVCPVEQTIELKTIGSLSGKGANQ